MHLIAALLLSTSFTGTWMGTSTCTDVRPACKNEIAVYHIVPRNASTVTATMNKVVDGKEVTMGSLDMHVDGETITGDVETPRVKSRWTLTREGSRLTGTARQLPGGEVIRNISLVSYDQLCDMPAVDGPIVVRGTILESNPANEHRPLVGADDIRRLWVPVRVDEIVKGSFLVAKGADFRLAVHSIALSFGYDATGEQFDIAFEKKGNAYAVLGLTPSPSSRVQLFGTVVGITYDSTKGALITSEHPDITLHLRTPDGDVAVALALGKTRAPAIGEQICALLVRRADTKVPYRVIRLVL